MPEKRVAKVPTGSEKAAVSVSDMAALCQLSRSRFHSLVRDCVFPKPRQDGERRPYYPHDLIQKCLDIRRTGIGANGQVVLFNRRAAPPVPPANRAKPPAPATASHPELVESLRSLGLAVTVEVVGAAVEALFAGGTGGVEHGELVRRVFLHLQARPT